MRYAWRHKLPRHLQETKMLYIAAVNVLCIVATTVGALTSPLAAVRWQCAIMTALLCLILVCFVRGMSLQKTIDIGSFLCTLHVTIVACLSQTIYTSVQAWLVLLCVTQFFARGARAGALWTLGVMGALLVTVAWALWVPGATAAGFGSVQASTSMSDYLLVSLSTLVVPWIYKHRYEQALADSQQRQHTLQAKQAELEHTVQLREQFIASVSHELRTPMNAILGLNSLLLERVQDRPQAHKVLEYTHRSAEHLMTVINDVLDYSQMSGGRLKAHEEVFELAATVRAAFELFEPQVENTALAYHCEIDPDVPRWVNTDRHRLMQVLVNLLGNAIKFTHQGSVRLRVQRVGAGVEFSVQDTGIGLSEQQQQRVFQRFEQADERIHARYGGSGLGLTISQNLVQMLGGHMGVRSQPGQGSRFAVWLPLQAMPAPRTVSPTAQALGPGRSPAMRFLVVDDHPVNRLLARQSLMRYWPGSEVDACENGALALQQMQATQGYDLVLMDMVMPEMDGIDATRLIRASRDRRMRSTPVLGLTANVNAHDLERFRRAGLDGLMLKPIDLAQLRTEVERLTRPERHNQVSHDIG